MDYQKGRKVVRPKQKTGSVNPMKARSVIWTREKLSDAPKHRTQGSGGAARSMGPKENNSPRSNSARDV